MAQDEVILDGDLSLDIPLDGDAQLDLQLDGAVGLLTLIEAGIAQIIFNDDYTITFILTDGREFTTGSIRGAVGEKGDKGDKGDTGASGKDGADGKDGINGTDGISPTVTITSITGGNRITITDADGQHSADVMDGDDYVLTAQDKADIAGLVDIPVTDVQINGASAVSDGVANIPIASANAFGVIKPGLRTEINASGQLVVRAASENEIKAGSVYTVVLTPQNQHHSVFYGLAKAAGHDEKNSALALGTYTPEALIAIQKMLGVYQAPLRTIKEITVTEETTDFYVNTDSFSNPFALKEVIVIFTGMTATGNGGGFLVVNNDSLSHIVSTKGFVNINNVYYSTAMNCMAHMWLSGGRFFGESMYSTTQYYTRVGIYSNMNAFGVIECDYINNLHMYSPNGHKLTGGTITIIGR